MQTVSPPPPSNGASKKRKFADNTKTEPVPLKRTNVDTDHHYSTRLRDNRGTAKQEETTKTEEAGPHDNNFHSVESAQGRILRSRK